MSIRTFCIKRLVCLLCDASVNVKAHTTSNPRCPEFYEAPPGAWLAVVENNMQLVCVCSETCLNALLDGAIHYDQRNAIVSEETDCITAEEHFVADIQYAVQKLLNQLGKRIRLEIEDR